MGFKTTWSLGYSKSLLFADCRIRKLIINTKEVYFASIMVLGLTGWMTNCDCKLLIKRQCFSFICVIVKIPDMSPALPPEAVYVWWVIKGHRPPKQDNGKIGHQVHYELYDGNNLGVEFLQPNHSDERAPSILQPKTRWNLIQEGSLWSSYQISNSTSWH